jgi:hypothetical protein
LRTLEKACQSDNVPCVCPVGLDRMTQTERGARDTPRFPARFRGLSGPLFRPDDCGRRA